MNHGISIRPSKDIRTNYAQISALTPAESSRDHCQRQGGHRPSQPRGVSGAAAPHQRLEAKLSMYAHLAQAMDDIRLGRVQSADAVFDELLGELEAPQE